MTATPTQIADKVRGLAAEKRFTQERMASTLGIARSSLTERLAGRIPFTAPEVFTLAVAMREPVARFFPDQSTPVPTSFPADVEGGGFSASAAEPESAA